MIWNRVKGNSYMIGIVDIGIDYMNKEFISSVGSSITRELDVSKIMKTLSFKIWVRRPNIMSIDIISPSGEN